MTNTLESALVMSGLISKFDVLRDFLQTTHINVVVQFDEDEYC